MLCQRGLQHDIESEALLEPIGQPAPRRSSRADAEPLPLTNLEALATILQDNIKSAATAATQQLHHWRLIKQQHPLALQQAAVSRGSQVSLSDDSDSEESIMQSMWHDQLEGGGVHHLQQQQQQQSLQQHIIRLPSGHGPHLGLSELGSKCSNAIQELHAAGVRQLDGMQAAAQQLVPWPQVHVQRRSALRLRIHSCTLSWPRGLRGPSLELNLNGL